MENVNVWLGVIIAFIGVVGFVFAPINSKLKSLMRLFESYQDKQQSLEVRIGILEAKYENLEKILQEIKSDVEYIKKNIK